MAIYTFLGGDLTNVNNYRDQNNQVPAQLPGVGDDVIGGIATSGSIEVHSWENDGASGSGTTIKAESVKNVTASNGGTIEVTDAFFAITDGNTIVVDGSGSQLVFTDPGGGGGGGYEAFLRIGGSGTAELDIQNGASQTIKSLELTGAVGTSGIARVTGSSSLYVSQDVEIPDFGVLEVTGHSLADVTGVLVTKFLSGSSSSGFIIHDYGILNVHQRTTIALADVDVFSQIYGGGVLNAFGGLTVGGVAGSRGDFWVQGTDSQLNTGGAEVWIGEDGRGTVHILDGAKFDATGGTVILGKGIGSQGKLFVERGVNPSQMFVEKLIVGDQGSGTFTLGPASGTITDNSTVDVNDELVLGSGSFSNGSVLVQSGGILSAGKVNIGGQGSGSLSVQGDFSKLDFTDMDLGFGSGGQGQFTVTSGAQVTGHDIVVGNSGIGGLGFLTVSGAGTITGTTIASMLKTDILDIGGLGTGSVTVSAGAKLIVEDRFSLNYNGFVTLTGDGSTLVLNNIDDPAVSNPGKITFGTGAQQLELKTEQVLKNHLDTFGLGDVLHLDWESIGAAMIYSAADHDLKVSSHRYYFDNLPTGAKFKKTADPNGGIDITIAIGNTIGGATPSVDNLVGTAQDDLISALGGNDSLSGLDGDDILDGEAGADAMAGGAGDDTYAVDDAGDQVIEDPNEGTDTVGTTLNAYTLSADVENLIFTGTGDFNGSGNGLDNVIVGDAGADTLNGGAGFDTIYGGSENDQIGGGDQGDLLYGEDGNDLINGGMGLDTIDGGIGNDTVNGGVGNDTIFGNLGFDAIHGNDGNDTINGGDQGDVIAGDAGDDVIGGGMGLDTIDGGIGNDAITGGMGNDQLTGGADADTFAFGSPGAANDGVDTIVDFVSGTDTIQVSAAGYGGGLTAGGSPTVLNVADHTTVAAGGGQFIFQTSDSTLWFDATGGSGADAIEVAVLIGVASLQATDFHVV